MTAKKEEFETLQEPLLVQADLSTEMAPTLEESSHAESSNSSTNNNSPDNHDGVVSLASQRQVRGAMWAGGIAGLLIGGPIGAGLGVWGGHYFSKNGDGQVGQFCRKTGDFVTRCARRLKQEWQDSTPDKSTEDL